MNIIPHSQPWITALELDAVHAVMKRSMLSRAEEMQELENRMGKYLNKKHALFTGNGTQAQWLILMGMGIGPGDEVILPSYVCRKVYTAVKLTGATPVLCDIGKDWVMTIEKTKEKVSARTRAVLLPHVYGLNAWNDGFAELGVPVIEDICQSFGHLDKANCTGTHTGAAFVSFHGTKPIAGGEGGMLFVNGNGLFEKIQEIRSAHPFISFGSNTVAAGLLAQFDHYKEALRKRNAIAKRYNTELPDALNADQKRLTDSSMNFRYVLKSKKDFEKIRQKFMEKNIHVRKGVDNMIHRDEALEGDFPNTETCFATSVSIPILPQMGDKEIQRVVEAVNGMYEQGLL